jgi:hypothetical protein
MKPLSFVLVLGGLCLAGCDEPSSTPAPAMNSNASSGNPLTAPVDYLGAVNAAQKQAANVVALTSLQQGIQAFQAGEDRLPANLQELVSEGYLPRLPDTPRGFGFDYNPRSGQVRLVAIPGTQ